MSSASDAAESGSSEARHFARELHGSRLVLGSGLLQRAGELMHDVPAVAKGRIAIISDDTVAPLYANALRAALGARGHDASTVLLTVPAGEASKTRKQWSRLTDELLDAGYGRDSVIIALGGGVVGDLAGFVAATYMRGAPVVQVPSSLLAMIDAAIGGKTGVDTRAGKNLVGAFHHPALVLVDPALLSTLPAQQFRAGLAEAVKHAVIASRPLFDWIEANAMALMRDGGPAPALGEHLVRENIEIKASVVERDERESGLRKTLNFGHTIGHAIEAASRFAMGHGECVAIGMVAESRLAARLGLASPDVADAIIRLLLTLQLPVRRPPALTGAVLLDASRRDKKAREGQVEYVLPVTIGRMAGEQSGYGIRVPDSLVIEVLDQL